MRPLFIMSLALLSSLSACEEPQFTSPNALPIIDGSVGSRAELSLSARATGGLGLLGILGVALDLGETRVMSDREPSEAVAFTFPSRVELLGGGESFEVDAIPPATYFAAALEPRPNQTIALEITLGLLGLTHTLRIDGLPPVELRCEEISVYLENSASLRLELELNLQNIVGLVIGLLPPIPLSLISIDPDADPTLHGQLASLFRDQWTVRCSVLE